MTPPGEVTFSSDLPSYLDVANGGKKYTVPSTGEYSITFKAGDGENVHWYFFNALNDTNNASYAPSTSEIAAKVREMQKHGWEYWGYDEGLYDYYSTHAGITFSADGIVKVNPANVSRSYETTAFYAVASNAAGISCSHIAWLDFSQIKTSAAFSPAAAPETRLPHGSTSPSPNDSTSESPVPEPEHLHVIHRREAASLETDVLAVVSNDEYMIAAVLPVLSADESGTYDLDVVLSDNIRAGAKLYWLAFAEPDNSDDDIEAEFFDDSGAEISTVPENHLLTVSTWLNKGKTYSPVICVRR